jgi:hypothetical protein
MSHPALPHEAAHSTSQRVTVELSGLGTVIFCTWIGHRNDHRCAGIGRGDSGDGGGVVRQGCRRLLWLRHALWRRDSAVI